MSFLGNFLTAGTMILLLMTLLWVFSLALKNASIVDIFWGTGFVITAWAAFVLTPEGFLPRKLLLCALVTIWGLRHSLHILLYNWGKAEGFRYQAWRKEYGAAWWWRSYFNVYLLQGIMLWIVAAPLLAALLSQQTVQFTLVDGFALLLWTLGFFFEAVGDGELTRFMADPANKGKLLNRGVWRYTRHPNYFGDAAQWWAFYLLALAGGGWWTIFSPILMTVLLVHISGIALLEATLEEEKLRYKEYVERTSAFIPWPPRKAEDQKEKS